MMKLKIRNFLLSIALFVIFGMTILSCGSATMKKEKYRYLRVDGMTCLYYFNGNQSGMSCNWDEWNGTKDLVIEYAN